MQQRFLKSKDNNDKERVKTTKNRAAINKDAQAALPKQARCCQNQRDIRRYIGRQFRQGHGTVDTVDRVYQFRSGIQYFLRFNTPRFDRHTKDIAQRDTGQLQEHLAVIGQRQQP